MNSKMNSSLEIESSDLFVYPVDNIKFVSYDVTFIVEYENGINEKYIFKRQGKAKSAKIVFDAAKAAFVAILHKLKI